MLARLCAYWIVVLSVLPFTAPFASIDSADFPNRPATGGTLSRYTTPGTASVSEETALVSERASLGVHLAPSLLPGLTSFAPQIEAAVAASPGTPPSRSGPPLLATVLRL